MGGQSLIISRRLGHSKWIEMRQTDSKEIYLLVNFGSYKTRDSAMVPRAKILKMTPKIRNSYPVLTCAIFSAAYKWTHPSIQISANCGFSQCASYGSIKRHKSFAFFASQWWLQSLRFYTMHCTLPVCVICKQQFINAIVWLLYDFSLGVALPSWGVYLCA